MVAPAQEALGCDSCHATEGRLASVGGFYLPGRDGFGIFLGEAHPAKPTVRRKHNPLQRLSYLFLKLVINLAIWTTGALYLTLPWTGLDLATIAWSHVVAAYAMAFFIIVHVYMATMGETVGEYIRAMITGYGWVVVDEAGRPARSAVDHGR